MKLPSANAVMLSFASECASMILRFAQIARESKSLSCNGASKAAGSTSLPHQAAQINDVEALPQMKWACAQWCYADGVNEVAFGKCCDAIILVGGFIGVLGSLYYLIFVRGFVMENKNRFLALETLDGIVTEKWQHLSSENISRFTNSAVFQKSQ